VQTRQSILEAALTLSDQERLMLVESLLSSLPHDASEVTDEAWHETLLRRSEEIESGKVTAIPWEQVKQQAREKNA
jgi:putative addiction module component (TIGR02574 family)